MSNARQRDLEVNRAAHTHLTQLQRDWVWFAPKCRQGLWRAANQVGKSEAQGYDLALYARNLHPRQRHFGPLNIMLVSHSFEQMDPMLGKLWSYLPRNEVDPKLRYSKGYGIRGAKQPVIKLVDGPGAGTIIVLATYKQGAERIMGGQYHRIGIDEPCPIAVYGLSLIHI